MRDEKVTNIRTRLSALFLSVLMFGSVLSTTAYAISSDLQLKADVESGKAVVDEDGGVWYMETQYEDVQHEDMTYTQEVQRSQDAAVEGNQQEASLLGNNAESYWSNPVSMQNFDKDRAQWLLSGGRSYSSLSEGLAEALEEQYENGVQPESQYSVTQLASVGVDGSWSNQQQVTNNNRPGVWDNAVGMAYHNGWMWKSYYCPNCNGGTSEPICDTHFLIDVKLDNSMKERVYVDKTCVIMYVVYKDSRRQQKFVPWAWSLTKTTSASWTPKLSATQAGLPTAWHTHDTPDNTIARNTEGWMWPIMDNSHNVTDHVKVWLQKQGVSNIYDNSGEWWVGSGGKIDVIWITKTDIVGIDPPPPTSGDVESILKAYDDKGVANFSDPVKGIEVTDVGGNGHGLEGTNSPPENYGYSSHCYSTAPAFEESRPDEIVPFHSGDPSTTGTGNYDIYNNPVTFINWHWDTPNGAETYYNKITVVTHYINRSQHHCEFCCSHCCDYVCGLFSCWCEHGPVHDHYTRSPGNTYSRTWEYNAEPPQLVYDIFNPINLNRNGPCIPIDYANETEFSVTRPELALSLDVDNKQNITGGVDDVTDDSNHIRMLDTNEAIPWEIDIKNDQLGIPTEAEGGFTMYDSQMDFWFAMGRDRDNVILGTLATESAELSAAGLGGQGDTMQDISYIVHYSPELYGQYNLGVQNIFTVEEDGGGENDAATWKIERDRSYTGQHEFVNRAIYYGDQYALMGQVSNFWEVWYSEVQYYTYGVCLGGYIDIEDPGGIPIRHTHLAQLKYESATYNEHVVQPWLRGNFVVKTVGGNVG